MDISEIKEYIDYLTDFYGVTKTSLKEIYRGLLNKPCFNIKDTYDILEYACQEKVSIQNDQEKTNRKRRYEYSNDFVVNKVIDLFYGEEAREYLDERYLKEIKIIKRFVKPSSIEAEQDRLSHYHYDGKTVRLILEYQYNGKIDPYDQD